MKDLFNATVLGIVLASLFWSIATYKYQRPIEQQLVPLGTDFHMYYYKALGDTVWEKQQSWYSKDQDQGWVYKDFVAFGFIPFTVFPLMNATLIWMAGMHLAYLIIVLNLLRIEYGWAIVLVTLKPFLMSLSLGNIATVLSLISITPLGVVLATLVKPYCAVFILVMAGRAFIVFRKESLGKAD